MSDPIALLRVHRAEARAQGDANAELCVLATVERGEPRARTVVLREIEAPPERCAEASGPAETRLGFFLNRTSAKHAQFAESATVAVLVYLPSVSAQYRLACHLEPVPVPIVHDRWAQRPTVAKRLDWLYDRHPQGTPMPSRAALAELLQAPCPDTAPASAIGYYIAPLEVERLLLAAPDAIHDRRRYRRVDSGWVEDTLVP